MELDNILKPEAIKKALLQAVPKGTEDLNTRAFDEGYGIFKNSQHL
jgi:2-oxoglutarate ferredoxin oxidoreductase subunit gamma